MDNFVMKCSETLITLEKDGHLCPNAKYDKQVCIELRNLAALTLCLCLLAHNVDLYEIRTYRWTEPGGNTKYPLGVLWLPFMRCKGKKRWFWEAFIPTSEPRPECPVRLFRPYLWKLHLNPGTKHLKRMLGGPTCFGVAVSGGHCVCYLSHTSSSYC